MLDSYDSITRYRKIVEAAQNTTMRVENEILTKMAVSQQLRI